MARRSSLLLRCDRVAHLAVELCVKVVVMLARRNDTCLDSPIEGHVIADTRTLGSVSYPNVRREHLSRGDKTAPGLVEARRWDDQRVENV
jgi:hypothetical protein